MAESLNALESAVLTAMCACSSNAAAIKSQVEKAFVLRRENTGVGFNTHLFTKSDALVGARTLYNVFAKVGELQNPVAFVLFFENGKISALEGATVNESSQEIDFSQTHFEIENTAPLLN